MEAVAPACRWTTPAYAESAVTTVVGVVIRPMPVSVMHDDRGRAFFIDGIGGRNANGTFDTADDAADHTADDQTNRTSGIVADRRAVYRAIGNSTGLSEDRECDRPGDDRRKKSVKLHATILSYEVRDCH
jgi:hypothetical protein